MQEGAGAGRRTGMRSLYFWRMRSASALRFSKGCSSLNLDRMVAGVCVREWLGVEWVRTGQKGASGVARQRLYGWKRMDEVRR
jgi:hypothetical protein